MATLTPRHLLVPIVTLGLLLQGVVAAAEAPVGYQLPVEGEVMAGFETPADHYAAGHRGTDLAVGPGTPVVAAAAGIVSHAGEVAGTTWVSVRHADGVVTSYGPLALLRVAVGDEVRGGTMLGAVAASTHGADGGGLHWGARRDGTYVDPLSLLGPVQVPSLVGPGGWSGTHHVIEPFEPWKGSREDGWRLHGSPRARGPSFGVPPNPNHLVLLTGLNSATGSPLIDPDHLGYGEADATRFSYAGLDARGEPKPYGPADTWDGVDAAARRLAEQLRRQQHEQPFRAVDLVGHSQGGVVILHYLANYHDPFDATLPPIGNVVTVASPHQGSDAANLGRVLREHTITGTVGAGAAVVHDPHAERWAGAVGRPFDELRVGSPQLRKLSHAWDDAVEAGTGGPLATGTRVLALGAAHDQYVGMHRARLPGTAAGEGLVLENRTLPGTHSGVLETEAVREVVYRFLQGGEIDETPARLHEAQARFNGTGLRVIGHGVQAHDLYLGGKALLKLTRTPPTVPGGKGGPWFPDTAPRR
ncbi:MAG TPA: peptidoglycan DD-metalloendopeptidase family protein [Egicoccus sp.]|nr:peptidoglycan DD-metalloendopeptidase family protein [Egicoccus sp.]HSK23550.1 peptidoglycan DD-metalloendopeptidase family protein [Egicoccus sp.]